MLCGTEQLCLLVNAYALRSASLCLPTAAGQGRSQISLECLAGTQSGG